MRPRVIISIVVGLMAVSVYAKEQSEQKVQGSVAIQGRSVADASRQAKVSAYQAMKAALGKVPGRVIRSALENEDGSLVYAIDIERTDKSRSEVLVDAGTGKILSLQSESGENSEDENG